MKIISYTIEKLEDPTSILSGERYEFFLDLEVDEEDELYSENGVRLRVLFYKNEEDIKVLNYYFLVSENILDFALDEDEEKMVTQFCHEHYLEAEQ